MQSVLSRRRLLKSAAGGLLFGAGFVGPNLQVEAAFGFRFSYDQQYGGNWVGWLQDVMGRATRMIQPGVIANLARLRGNGYNLHSGVWARSNNAYNPIPYWRSYATLMEFQLASLRVNNFQPRLHIQWGFEENAPWWGRANLATIAVIYDRQANDVRVEGDFLIQLNAYWATTRDSRNSHDVWGGVIAHELCHNLGHGHGVNEYDDRWPINILDRCVTYNGNYRGGYRQYNWLCGGRLTG